MSSYSFSNETLNMFAISDVNSMYCSCEQALRPDLADRAVLVVSNSYS